MNFSRNVANCITNVNPDSQGAFRHANGTSTNAFRSRYRTAPHLPHNTHHCPESKS